MSKQHKLEETLTLYIKCCYHMEKSHLVSLYHKKLQNFIPSLKLTLCDLAVVCKLLYYNNGIENTPLNFEQTPSPYPQVSCIHK